VVITVVSMLVVQAPINNIICVIPMLYRFMATIRPMSMATTSIHWVTRISIGTTQLDNMTITVIPMRMMELAIN
jgi:hypothetical protein